MNHTLFNDSISTVLFLLLCFLEMHACPLRTEMESSPALRKGQEMYFNQDDFGKRLQQLRKDKDMIQEDLAPELYISIEYLKKLETGKRRPSLELLISISEYFDVSTDYLLTGKERICRQTKKRLNNVMAELAIIRQEMA